MYSTRRFARFFLSTLLVSMGLTVFAVPVLAAFDHVYDPSTGLLPSEVCDPWSGFVNNAGPGGVVGGVLRLGSATAGEYYFYQQPATGLVFPDTISVEFEVQRLSGSDADAAFSSCQVRVNPTS